MATADGPSRYSFQHHDASREHYDLRLESGGVLLSWAVPKGPSLDPADKRLAVRTPDHHLDHLEFEGTIPAGEYGGGAVVVWDLGTWTNETTGDDGRPVPVADAVERGHLRFAVDGEKLGGSFALQRFRPDDGLWLLVKVADDDADPACVPVRDRPESVLTGRTVVDVARDADVT